MMQGFITVIVGVSLIPTVADTISSALSNGTISNNVTNTTFPGNVTGSAASILELTTLFFALGIMVAGIGIAVGGLADIGLI